MRKPLLTQSPLFYRNFTIGFVAIWVLFFKLEINSDAASVKHKAESCGPSEGKFE